MEKIQGVRKQNSDLSKIIKREKIDAEPKKNPSEE